MKLTLKQIEKIKAHAIEEYNKESCGFIVGGKYIKMKNIHDKPEKAFHIASGQYIKYSGKLQAIVHSHPDQLPQPSELDMKSQQNTAVPWAIVGTDGEICSNIIWFGDQEEREPLVGRVFVHGVTDCFSLVRDYFLMEHNIILEEMPRSDDWWRKGKNLYLDYFKEWGFYEIDISDAKPGDCFLAKVLSPVPNHGGIICDKNLILHHLYGRLSRYDPLGPWLKKMTKILRCEKLYPKE